jgi:hypothetical protein
MFAAILTTLSINFNIMTKRELKSMVAHAYELQSQTVGTQVVFQVYADGHYILDTEEDNVIEVLETEEEAISMCSNNELKGCYYKPILIDAIDGERITRKNFDSYKK